MPKFICVFALLLTLCAGCAWNVYPPATAKGEDTVAVYVCDYGYHSSLLLPLGNHQYIEYVYGDWGYAAENRNSPCDAMGALFGSNQAALGRRTIELDEENPQVDNQGDEARISKILLPRTSVQHVVKIMDERYAKDDGEKKLNPLNNQLYVKDPDHYSLGNSCNTMTARNLKMMGCRVEGNPVLSNFKVVSPNDP